MRRCANTTVPPELNKEDEYGGGGNIFGHIGNLSDRNYFVKF